MKKYRNRSQSIQDFLHQRTLAVVGVSRNGKKFGRMVYSQLKEKGYRVFPINPNTEAVNGDRCYPTLSKLPEPVGGVVLIVPPVQAEQVVREASALGIQHVWLQQGAESDDAIQFCTERGINVVAGECIMMFAEPVRSFHRFHRFVWKLFGKLPS